MHLVKLLLSIILSFAWPSPIVGAAEPTWQEQQNLPSWALVILEEKGFASTYTLSNRINPYFLHGDFNGDGKLDVAVMIVKKDSGHHGIAIVHAGLSTVSVVGAGQSIGSGGNDFSWLDAWSLSARQPVQPGASGKKPPVLKGDALLVQKLEAASALIYWDGMAYRWYQQGD